MEARYALPIFYMILDGMSFAHSFGYIHRDVKPNNILLNKRGEAKVTPSSSSCIRWAREATW